MAIVSDLKSKDIVLNRNGMYDMKGVFKKAVSNVLVEFTEQELLAELPIIEKIMKIIPLLVLKTGKKALVKSYGLKEILENVITEKYVSNGTAIIAMILLGYKYTLFDSINVSFHCSYAKNDFKKSEYKHKILF